MPGENGESDPLQRVHHRIDQLALKMAEAEAERDKALLRAVIKYLLIALAGAAGFAIFELRMIQNAGLPW